MESSRDDFVIAIRSAFLKKGNQQRFSLLSLILFSIIFLILGNFNNKVVNFNKTIIKEIIYLSSFIVTIPENLIIKSFNATADHFEYYNKYVITKNELQDLKNKDLSKKIIAYENIELKKLIDDYFIEDSQVYAKVLLDKESPFLRSIIINKGSKNGIKPGMVVYEDIYLIGKVVEVNYITSRVLLISDINSKVPVTIQPLDIEAIMSGHDQQNGKLQYIRGEKIIGENDKELGVVTSGSGGVFKSGIPVGKIDLTNISKNNEIIVNFYRDFTQLKYVKILSYKKESTQLDQNNKIVFEEKSKQIIEINSQDKDIKVLQQQKIINKEIRNKLEIENTKLKENLINTQKEVEKQKNKLKEIQVGNQDIEFLELNLLHGHKCRKTFLRPKLFKINTLEYRACVLSKGIVKNN